MKILFLDIDGVLCTDRSVIAYRNTGLMQVLDPVAVKLIDRLCEETGCKIVMSSTWAEVHDKSAMTCILMNAGMTSVPFHDDWMTPRKMSSNRGQEIGMWLEAHPEITKYAVVDDNAYSLDSFGTRFIKTGTLDGLMYEDYKSLLGALSDE